MKQKIQVKNLTANVQLFQVVTKIKVIWLKEYTNNNSENNCILRQELLVKNLLFGRIGKLVFPTPIITLLDAGIRPQIFNSFNIGTFESSHSLVVNVLDQVCLALQKTKHL